MSDPVASSCFAGLRQSIGVGDVNNYFFCFFYFLLLDLLVVDTDRGMLSKIVVAPEEMQNCRD